MSDDAAALSHTPAGDPEVVIWHHGLVARWWANFNLDGPEVAYFRTFVEAGQPALDVGCGSGRLLVPWVAAGLDVDGADASADMITACREALHARGLDTGLFVQPVHRLDLPRRYGTVVMCGVLGLGVTAADDLDGLRRVRQHLRPGGRLALDYEVGEVDPARWATWRPRPADPAPPPPEERRLGPDGFTYALRHRTVALDVEARRSTRELQAWQWRDGELIAHEAHALVTSLYGRDDVVGLLHEAGFVDVEVVGGYHGGPPRGDERFLVYLATAP